MEPSLDLSVGHLEALGHGCPLRGGEVLLLVEALLQLADLDPAEGRPRLLPLGRRPVLVGVADPPGRHPGGGRYPCRLGWEEDMLFENDIVMLLIVFGFRVAQVIFQQTMKNSRLK